MESFPIVTNPTKCMNVKNISNNDDDDKKKNNNDNDDDNDDEKSVAVTFICKYTTYASERKTETLSLCT